MKAYWMAVALVAASTTVAAQTTTPQDNIQIFNRRVGGPGVMMGGAPADHLMFVAAEFSFDGNIVKGAPYSAEAVTETTQTLADGNRIKRKNTAQLYRDSEGRTRREQTLQHIGPWSSESGVKSVIIHDPVADARYVLDPEAKTARKMPSPRLAGPVLRRSPEGQAPAAGVPVPHAAGIVHAEVGAIRMEGPGEHIEIRHFERPIASAGEKPNFNSESLGTRVIEGVVAEGTKTTLTIPASQIGNEKPIEVVTERWYSPELQTVVMTQTSDPRMGETVFKLTGISRAEPPKNLFEVPPDYTVQEVNMRGPHVDVLRKIERAPQP